MKLLDTSFNGLAITDEQGDFEYVNDFFLKITGWPEEELLGQSFFKIFPETVQEFIHECWREFQKILNMNKAGLEGLGCNAGDVIGTHVSRWFTTESTRLTMETIRKRILGESADDSMIRQVITKGGEVRWVEIRSRIIRKDVTFLGYHGIARDITENMILKNELKKSNKKQKLLCYLIKGTRGGKIRTLILRHLAERSYNAHQLAKVLNVDYKTVRHHLEVLVKNEIVIKNSCGYSALYFISNKIQSDLNGLTSSSAGSIS